MHWAGYLSRPQVENVGVALGDSLESSPALKHCNIEVMVILLPPPVHKYRVSHLHQFFVGPE